MSRRFKISIICFLACFISLGAFAADEAQRAEIIYRASFGRADDIKLLITQGASPNQTNGDGVPIIAIAAVRNDSEAVNVIKMLLDMKANINAVDTKGENALFYAAKAGNLENVKLLLDNKIDYQAIDANGNSARSEAAAAGHQDILDAIDSFVRMQNQIAAAKKIDDAKKAAALAQQAKGLVAITDQQSKQIAESKMKDASSALEKTPEAVANDDQGKEPFEIDERKLEAAASEPANNLTPEQQKQFDSIVKHSIDNTQPKSVPEGSPTPKTPAELAAEAKAQEAADEKKKKEIKSMAYDVAYHTCAFQYWVYVLQVRQSTELASEELTIAIQTQKDATEALEKKLLMDYHLPSSFYDNITSSAQLRIYDQLNGMASNRVRHENGVGKMDDMENRCEEIARQWGFPASYKSNPSDIPNGGGKGGSTGNAKSSLRPNGHR